MNSDIRPQEESVPVYRYPERFLYAEVVLFSLVSALMIFAWIPALISFFAYGNVLSSAIRAMVFLNVTAVALLLLFFFIRGELKSTAFFISGNYLCRRNSGGVIRVPLNGISSVTLLKFPLGAGLVMLESSGGTLSIPLMLDNVDELLCRIETECFDTSGSTYDAVLWKRVHAVAIAASLAGKRSDRSFGRILGLCILMLPVNIFTGAFFWDMSLIPLAVWAVAGPFFPLVGYAVSDLITRHYERKTVAAGADELQDGIAATVTVRSAIAIFCCYLAAGIFFRSLLQ